MWLTRTSVPSWRSEARAACPCSSRRGWVYAGFCSFRPLKPGGQHCANPPCSYPAMIGQVTVPERLICLFRLRIPLILQDRSRSGLQDHAHLSPRFLYSQRRAGLRRNVRIMPLCRIQSGPGICRLRRSSILQRQRRHCQHLQRRPVLQRLQTRTAAPWLAGLIIPAQPCPAAQ